MKVHNQNYRESSERLRHRNNQTDRYTNNRMYRLRTLKGDVAARSRSASSTCCWRPGFLTLLAIVGIADYLLTIAALHFVRPDVNPVLEPMSNYAVGPYGFLLTAADIGYGLAALTLMVGLYLGIAPPGRSYLGLFLLGLYGVSVLLAGFFTIDVGGEATTVGTIHNIVGNISFFGFPIAAILLSLGMGKDERWRSFRRPALALAGVVVLTVILTMVGFNIGIGFGVNQRIANVAAMLWMLAVALHLRSVARGALAQQPSRVR